MSELSSSYTNLSLPISDPGHYLPRSLLVSPREASSRSYDCHSYNGTDYTHSHTDYPRWDLNHECVQYVDDFTHSTLQQEYIRVRRQREREWARVRDDQRNPVHVPYVIHQQFERDDINLANSHRNAPPPHQPLAQNRTATPPRKNRKNKASEKADVYDAECRLHLVRSQLEFYFSDRNLFDEQRSTLQYYMKLSQKKWIPVHVLLDLPDVARQNADLETVVAALRTSSLLELNDDESKCRRPNYVPPLDYRVRKNLRRSVLVYGLSKQMTDKKVRKLLRPHGNILCVAFAGMEEGPEPEIGSMIMKKKLEEGVDTEALTTAFVVFESQSQANKCVKARSRQSVDGIRTMHKYDYNKVVKRCGKGQSPLLTPQQSPVVPQTMSKGIHTDGHGMKSIGNFQLNQGSTTQTVSPSVFMKRDPPQQNSRHPSSNQWRVPNKHSKSLNWRSGSPMRQRSNSSQNRVPYMKSNNGFAKQRFSKENRTTFPQEFASTSYGY